MTNDRGQWESVPIAAAKWLTSEADHTMTKTIRLDAIKMSWPTRTWSEIVKSAEFYASTFNPINFIRISFSTTRSFCTERVRYALNWIHLSKSLSCNRIRTDGIAMPTNFICSPVRFDRIKSQWSLLWRRKPSLKSNIWKKQTPMWPRRSYTINFIECRIILPSVVLQYSNLKHFM